VCYIGECVYVVVCIHMEGHHILLYTCVKTLPEGNVTTVVILEGREKMDFLFNNVTPVGNDIERNCFFFSVLYTFLTLNKERPVFHLWVFLSCHVRTDVS
jgi:hypothetical protein